MSWPDDIIANLPPPHDGEPAGLRRDILDELADHLECATRRQLRATDDPHQARRAALARFGDPRRLARRLWLDAMKEQLMNQRIFLVTQAVIILALLVLCTVVIMSLRQNHLVQQALLARLESAAQATAAPSAPPASYDWPRFSIRVLSPDGTFGMADMEAILTGDAYNEGKSIPLRAVTDHEGRAAFGPMRPGGYSLVVKRTDGASVTQTVPVPPGPEQPPLVIRWIETMPQPVAVMPRVDAPTSLDNTPWLMSVQIAVRPRAAEGLKGTWWWPSIQFLFDNQNRVGLANDGQMPGRSILPAELEQIQWKDRLELDASMRYFIRGATFLVRPAPTDPASAFERVTELHVFDPDKIDLTRDPGQEFWIKPRESIADALDGFYRQRERERRLRPPSAGNANP